MTSEEHETIINLTYHDGKGGLLSFYTSYEPHWRKLKRVVGNDLQVERLHKNSRGKITGWEAMVPLKYFSKALGFHKPRQKRVLTEAERQLSRDKMAKINAKKWGSKNKQKLVNGGVSGG